MMNKYIRTRIYSPDDTVIKPYPALLLNHLTLPQDENVGVASGEAFSETLLVSVCDIVYMYIIIILFKLFKKIEIFSKNNIFSLNNKLFLMSKRCSCFAITTSKNCKKNYSFIIGGKKYCTIHTKIMFNKYAILIQKIWKGYRTRCLMKNIYTKLPDELQRKIIFHVRENYLIKKHQHNVICKIFRCQIR